MEDSMKYVSTVAIALTIAGLLVVPAALAQDTERPPTVPQQGAGTPMQLPPSSLPDDDGGDPSVVTWSEFLEQWLTPIELPRSMIIRIDEKYCYPHPAVSIKMEIVREEDDTVWVRGLPPEDPESPLHRQWLEREGLEALNVMKDELEAEHGQLEYYVDFRAPIVPPPSMSSLEFSEVVSGLPDGGKWQMSLDFADMDGDGRVDLIAPPMRKGIARPFVFLNRDDGKFTLWRTSKFADGIGYDYGGIAAGDFDGDGHQDVVLAIHFGPQVVFYGDGEGNFLRAVELPTPDDRITSRAVTVDDFDLDGRPDVAFLAEIDYDLQTSLKIQNSPSAWVVLNREDGWKLHTEDMPKGVIGDNIDSGDVDGDGRPDLVFASNNGVFRELVHFNTADGWEPVGSLGVLSNAYHFDVDLAKGDDGTPELYAGFAQFTSIDGSNQARGGIVRYELGDDGLRATTGPLFVDDLRFDPVVRLAAGDLNGDGVVDVVAGRKKGGLEVYVQTADGQWYRERADGLETTGARPYAVRLRDLDGDGRDDVVVSFADGETEPGGGAAAKGGIRVWLTRPSS
jgi:hypothetical protein